MLPAHPEDELNNLGRCVATQLYQKKVWVGSAEGLLSFFVDEKDQRKKFETKPIGDVQALCVALGGRSGQEETLWLLSRPYGLGSVSASGYPHFHVPVGSHTGLPSALAASQERQLYMTTSRGLYRLRGRRWHSVTSDMPPAPARHLLQTANGIWWLGTTRGLYQLKGSYWRLAGEQPGPLQACINGLLNIGDLLWAATDNGLWKRHGNKWEPHDIMPNDPTSPVRALAPASKGHQLWVASQEGIARYNPHTRQTTAFYTSFNSGLGSHRINALFEGAGALWIVTQVGISRLQLD